MVVAVHKLAPRWTAPMALTALLIFMLSVSLGWHYAADGIVGGLAAVGCYRLCLRLFEPERKAIRVPAHSTGIQQA
jgi:membrane-associated phospholipid phosphatase